MEKRVVKWPNAEDPRGFWGPNHPAGVLHVAILNLFCGYYQELKKHQLHELVLPAQFFK
jgi:hypothetical protein